MWNIKNIGAEQMSKYKYTAIPAGSEQTLINNVIVNHSQGVITVETIRAKLYRASWLKRLPLAERNILIASLIRKLGYYRDGNNVYRYPAAGAVVTGNRPAPMVMYSIGKGRAFITDRARGND